MNLGIIDTKVHAFMSLGKHTHKILLRNLFLLDLNIFIVVFIFTYKDFKMSEKVQQDNSNFCGGF